MIKCKMAPVWVGVLAITLAACKLNTADPESSVKRDDNWNESSHGNSTAPDYEAVFPQNKVNTIEIILGASGWQAIRNDMISLAGNDFGAGGGNPGQGGGNNGGIFPGNGEIPGEGQFPGNGQIPGGGQFPGNGQVPGGGQQGGMMPGGGQGGAVSIFSRDPEYVSSTVKFNGEEWRNVGFRLKGNSSLSDAWFSGIYKLPFRLHFDKYEEEYPEITDQRLFGFKELSMSPAQSDNTLMKDKLASDLFRLAGVPAAQTAFYKIYIDFGEGLKYCGLYTVIEVIDDTMVKTQFGDDNGNIYKPESTLQSYIEDQFEKKNNKTKADFTDVQKLVSNLNSNTRSSDPPGWKRDLESIFNVDHFLNYLAVNNTIVNWDSYGSMAHNYYLYNHNGRLTWIPWDHNLAFNISPGGGNPVIGGNDIGGISIGNPGGGNPEIGNAAAGLGVSLEMTEVNQTWPLIRHLADQSEYYERYKGKIATFTSEVFTPSKVNAMIDKNYNLIREYVTGSEPEQANYTYLSSPAAFETGISQLKTHINSRYEAARAFAQ